MERGASATESQTTGQPCLERGSQRAAKRQETGRQKAGDGQAAKSLGDGQAAKSLGAGRQEAVSGLSWLPFPGRDWGWASAAC